MKTLLYFDDTIIYTIKNYYNEIMLHWTSSSARESHEFDRKEMTFLVALKRRPVKIIPEPKFLARSPPTLKLKKSV